MGLQGLINEVLRMVKNVKDPYSEYNKGWEERRKRREWRKHQEEMALGQQRIGGKLRLQELRGLSARDVERMRGVSAEEVANIRARQGLGVADIQAGATRYAAEKGLEGTRYAHDPRTSLLKAWAKADEPTLEDLQSLIQDYKKIYNIRIPGQNFVTPDQATPSERIQKTFVPERWRRNWEEKRKQNLW